MTAKELAETAAARRDADAAMIHPHVRDHDGAHLLDQHAYRGAPERPALVRVRLGPQ